MLGVIFSFSHRKFTVTASLVGLIAGCAVFGVRMYDPRGMNLLLMAFNRRLVVTIAVAAVASLVIVAVSSLLGRKFLRHASSLILSVLIVISLTYLVPPALQYTREFVYFGESGISTNAMLRALGFTMGICLCLLLSLGGYEAHSSLNTQRQGDVFMLLSLAVFAMEYSVAAVTALQRLKVLKIADTLCGVSVFDVMIWRDANPNAFLYAQLGLALLMLSFVIITHIKPEGTFPNRAIFRKENYNNEDLSSRTNFYLW